MATRGLVALVSAPLILLGCNGVRQLRPSNRQNPTPPSMHLASIPIIVVGRIRANENIGSPRKEDEFSAPVQLCRVTIQIENILRGRDSKGSNRCILLHRSGVDRCLAAPRNESVCRLMAFGRPNDIFSAQGCRCPPDDMRLPRLLRSPGIQRCASGVQGHS